MTDGVMRQRTVEDCSIGCEVHVDVVSLWKYPGLVVATLPAGHEER